MIAYLTGSPIFQAQQVVVVTGGVGYLVHVGNTLLSQLSSQQAEQVSLHIYTHVKEDRLELYGFDRLENLELFKLLIAISGVGPKTAQNLVDAGSERLIEAVRQAQTSFFTSVPRVGKKLAQKIIIELKSKLGSLQELNLSTLSPTLSPSLSPTYLTMEPTLSPSLSPTYLTMEPTLSPSLSPTLSPTMSP